MGLETLRASSASTGLDTPVEVVRIREWRWQHWAFGMSFATVGALLGGALTFAAGDAASTPGGGLGLVILGVGLWLFAAGLYFLFALREVAVGPAGVMFVMGRRGHFAGWESIAISPYPPAWGGVGFRIESWTPGPPPVGGGILVTRRQAFAILTHPSAPNWQVRPEIWAFIGHRPNS